MASSVTRYTQAVFLSDAARPTPRQYSRAAAKWGLRQERSVSRFSPPLRPPRETPAGQAGVWSDEASFARRNAMQPGTWATLNPWSRSGPLKSYLRNRARYRS